MSAFLITRRNSKEYQYALVASNGQLLMSGDGFPTVSACEAGIESIKKYALSKSNFERRNSSDAKYYFVLKASNGQTIGVSEMYETTVGRDGGITAVMHSVSNAPVEDRSEG